MFFNWMDFAYKAREGTITDRDAAAAHSAVDAAFARSLASHRASRQKPEMPGRNEKWCALSVSPASPAWLSGVEASLPLGDRDG